MIVVAPRPHEEFRSKQTELYILDEEQLIPWISLKDAADIQEWRSCCYIIIMVIIIIID